MYHLPITNHTDYGSQNSSFPNYHNNNNYGDYIYYTWYHFTSFLEYTNVRDDPRWRIAIRTFRAIFDVHMPVVISTFGIVSNVMNLIIFRRRGYHDNNCMPSLVAMALSDLAYCVFSFLAILNKIGKNVEPALGYDVLSAGAYQWTGSQIPGVIFVRFSEWILAYFAFERMVSVTIFTFQVKWFFTPQQSCVTIFIILVMTLLTHVHLFLFLERSFEQNVLTWEIGRFHSVYTGIVSEKVAYHLFYIHENIFGPTCYILMILITFVTSLRLVILSRRFQAENLVYRLGLEAPKDQNDAPNREELQMSPKREIQLVYMSLAMSIVFLFCYFLDTLLCYARHDRDLFNLRERKFVSVMLDLYYELNFVLMPCMKMFYSSFKIAIYVTLDGSYRREMGRVWYCRK